MACREVVIAMSGHACAYYTHIDDLALEGAISLSGRMLQPQVYGPRSEFHTLWKCLGIAIA